jgi:TRAP-type transport system periplasmic protein
MRGLLALALVAGVAHAEPKHVIRLSCIAPEGSLWGREMRAFAREVESGTRGGVHVKTYLGGITGTEAELPERFRRNQLDGAASGGMFCQQAAPSMRILRVQGVFNDRDEAAYISRKLRDTIDAEMKANGFINLGTVGLGSDSVLVRSPVTTLDELRKQRLWLWDLDEVGIQMSRGIGLQVVTLPVEQAAQGFDDKQTDGFIAIPTAVLGFQWYTRARYLLPLHMGFITACMPLTRRSFDRLSLEQQKIMLAAAAKLAARIDDLSRRQDDALLGGLFQKQGVQPLPVSSAMRREFLGAARQIRERLGEKLVPKALLERVLAWLADYRSEHERTGKR